MHSQQYNTGYYQDVKDSWTAVSYPIIHAMAEEILTRHLDHASDAALLDLGCGSGIYGRLLSCFGTVYGLDFSRAALEKPLSDYGGGLLQGSATALPFADNSLDVVFTSEVLEHIADWRLAISEMRRVLRPGGILILTTTHYATSIYIMLLQKPGPGRLLRGCRDYLAGYFSLRRRQRFIRQWACKPLGGHYHGFFLREIRQRMTKEKFVILAERPFYAYPPIFLAQGANIRQFLSHSPRPAPAKVLLLPLVALLSLLDPLLRRADLFANNFFIAARLRQNDTRQ